VTYGYAEDAGVRAIQVESGSAATAFTVHGVRFKTSLAGRHSVSNVLAGLAVAHVLGIELSELVEAVEGLRPGKMRGERITRDGITILNDSYNSNPEAARSMIDVLHDEPAQRRIAVLGEMLELGRMAEKLHRDLGTYVAKAGVDVLVGVRGASRFMVEEAIENGLDRTAFFFDEPEAAGTFLKDFVQQGDAILFKGSRGTHVEKALARIEK
nr:UDP-N-acetylmuramoyl-tripeptide--D-alanyl-D-alanine ligase [Acidobacteriota bacterium]